MGYRQEQGAVAGGVGGQQFQEEQRIINQLNDVTAQNAANAAAAEANAEAAQLAAELARDAAQTARLAAETAETNAETAETNAATSATAASTSASNAAGSASSAATSASNAANSASQASTHASNAATSASNAATSASNAATSETNAAASAAAAAASYDSFDDRYLGAKASDPTLDNDGNALVTGALYFNTTSSGFKGYNGTSWISLPATTATNVTFSATGNIAATNVQTAIAEVDSEKVAKAGDTMTGTLVVPAVQMDTPFSFRNKIINGGFDIWQRAASQTTDGYGSDDRWRNQHGGSTKEHSQQMFAAGQTDVDGNPKYFSRTVVNSVAGSGNYVAKVQRIEDVSTLSGKTVTLSFYAKADAAKSIAVEIEQYFGTGGTPSASVLTFVAKQAITTGWTRYSLTFAVPSISGKVLGTNNNHSLFLNIFFDAGSSFNSRTGALGQQSGTFDIAQVQVEEGLVATPFEQRPIGLELSLCQRYFCKTFPYATPVAIDAGANGTLVCQVANVSTFWGTFWQFPVVMRTSPTVSFYRPTNGVGTGQWANGSNSLGSTPASGVLSPRGCMVYLNSGTNIAYAGSGDIYYIHATADAEL